MTHIPSLPNKPFTKLLVANRGEISCRIIRTAKRMGLRTVAVFSEADRDAEHVSLADEAILIGPPQASESYLRIDRIIEAATRMGAEAIHPGYGFLSENVELAIACKEAGIVFVGPSIDAIRAMASKSAAKALMERSGVPLVPGYHGPDQAIETLEREASRIGYPVLIKASAGGGGKGMRIVEDASTLAAAIASAKREAMSAFGDDHVLIEKYLIRPRHIEVQIFGDVYGNIVSLFERECTLQRRHQKVIEEAPAASLSEEQRNQICAAARVAAAAVNYTNAGTVEFVFNADGFYFIEMNTRLQVEHPVTEAITGLDLVEWQLRVAFGERLPLRQEQITCRQHAIEARIYAEDPENGFLPSIGLIQHWHQPETTDGIRIDSGFRAGSQITPYYDPMLAKLIVSGSNRLQALDRLRDALAQFQISGVKTNLGFLHTLVSNPDVRAGALDTGFIERTFDALIPQVGGTIDHRDLAAAAAAILMNERSTSQSPWAQGDGWMMSGARRRRLDFGVGAVTVVYGRHDFHLEIENQPYLFRATPRIDQRIDVFFDGQKEVIATTVLGQEIEIVTPRGRRTLLFKDQFSGATAMVVGSGHLRAPMPGSVINIMASVNQRVKRGAPLLIIEAMKMEHTVTAPADGLVVGVGCAVGEFVQAGTTLVELELDRGE